MNGDIIGFIEQLSIAESAEKMAEGTIKINGQLTIRKD